MQLDRRNFLGVAAGALAWGCGGATRSTVVAPAPTKMARVIRLDANENPYGPGPAARAAMRGAEEEVCRYAVTEDLVAAIAKRHGVADEQIVLGSGSYGVLAATVEAVVGRGDATVVANPAFDAVATYAEARGPVTRVPLDREARHDLDAMAAAIGPATKLVYVCNPNNPTGTLVGDLRGFCERHGGRATILVDEAYAEYVPELESMDALVRAGAPIIVSRTFSKLFGLAGLRVGYAIAPAAIAAKLRAARGGPDKVWVSSTGARAALASLGDAAFVEETRRAVAVERDKIAERLRGLGATVPRAHASFVYFPHPRPMAVRDAMAARGIRIGAHKGACRISIGLPAEMAVAGDAIAAVLA
jgi:histidinol-phosphate aminotransferase